MSAWPAPDPATRIRGFSTPWVPPFNESATCWKCGAGWGFIATRYDSGTKYSVSLGITTGPVMVRDCVRCGYTWHERPLG